MATGELRERVRERLVSAEQALGRAPRRRSRRRGRAAARGGPPEEVALRRARLARALADFDAATIATTHGFCQEVLGGLGVAGDVERDADVRRGRRPTSSTRWSTTSTCAASHRADAPPFTRAEARRIAAPPSSNPAARASSRRRRRGDRRGDARAGSPCAVREELERRKRRTGVMTYDDLLDAAARRRSPATAARRSPGGCASAGQVVLVDEFQDTDPVQWDIMRRAFGTAERSC